MAKSSKINEILYSDKSKTMTHPMKNPSKIIVPILIRSVSSLRHRVYCILSLELG